MQKLLIRYEAQINSLNEELKQKSEKMKILVDKEKSPDKKEPEQEKEEKIEDKDIVNLDNDEKDNEILNQLKELNSLKEQIEILKTENKKLISELQNKNNSPPPQNSPIKNEKETEKIIFLLKEKNTEYENEINNLKNKLNEVKKDLDNNTNHNQELINEIKEINV